MRTTRIQILFLGLFLLTSMGCGKKPCQTLLQTVPKSLTEYEWALRSTSEKSVKVDNYNYVIWKFNTTFDGLLKTVSNNTVGKDEDAKPFIYYVSPKGKVCIDYDRVTTKANLGTLCENDASQVYHYVYEFDKSKKGTLYLTQVLGPQPSGVVSYTTSYFNGAINPDNFCQF